VLNRGFAAIGRGRRPLLAAAAVAGGALGAGRFLGGPRWFALLAVSVLLTLALLGLGWRALAFHPPVLRLSRGEPGFVTPDSPQRVLLAAGLTVMLTGQIGAVAADNQWPVLNAALTAWLALLLALTWHGAWRWTGVRLRPEGMLVRHEFGYLFAPWAAFVADFPAVATRNNQLVLSYQRPDLVRRRGLRRGIRSLTTPTDAAYLARVIHEYVTHPERRAAVGTEAELRRVARALGGWPAGPVPGAG
jgi:hypothetical protein